MGLKRVELLILSALVPKTNVYANSTTDPYTFLYGGWRESNPLSLPSQGSATPNLPQSQSTVSESNGGQPSLQPGALPTELTVAILIQGF
jgi:hypothetical protein